MKKEQLIALLDHELSHIELVRLKGQALKQAMADSAVLVPGGNSTDHARPCLKSVKGDFNAGDGFKSQSSCDTVKMPSSFSISAMRKRSVRFLKEGAEEREQTLLTFWEQRPSANGRLCGRAISMRH